MTKENLVAVSILNFSCALNFFCVFTFYFVQLYWKNGFLEFRFFWTTWCHAISSVISEKSSKNLKTCNFLKGTCQVDQEKYKKHVSRYQCKIEIQSYKINDQKWCYNFHVSKFCEEVCVNGTLTLYSYFPLPFCFV